MKNDLAITRIILFLRVVGFKSLKDKVERLSSVGVWVVNPPTV
jgi:hypothetical protein